MYLSHSITEHTKLRQDKITFLIFENIIIKLICTVASLTFGIDDKFLPTSIFDTIAPYNEQTLHQCSKMLMSVNFVC